MPTISFELQVLLTSVLSLDDTIHMPDPAFELRLLSLRVLSFDDVSEMPHPFKLQLLLQTVLLLDE